LNLEGGYEGALDDKRMRSRAAEEEERCETDETTYLQDRFPAPRF
jgi:hypothetical protein